MSRPQAVDYMVQIEIIHIKHTVDTLVWFFHTIDLALWLMWDDIDY